MGNYVNQADLEQYTGFASQDFRQACVTMTATQWSTFATSVCTKVTQLINRFCCVDTLEVHTATQYDSGRGDGQEDYRNYFYYSGSNPNSQKYTDLDRSFYLFEVCNTSTNIKVEEDITTTSTPTWTERTQRTDTATGDYTVITHNDLTVVRFINNVPMKGVDNVRITYQAGYSSGSQELEAIKLTAIEMAQNLLVKKKKTQEASTIRNVGVRDFSPMFELGEDRVLLSAAIKDELTPYKRHLMLSDVYSAF